MSLMHDPTDPHAAPSHPSDAAPRSSRRVPILFLLFVAALAAAGTAFATREFRRWTPDPKPLDRPWINAPFITTPMNIVEEMLKVAEVKEEDVLYDLGCGDGRIAVVAAEKYGCRSVGYDIEPERIRESRENAKNRGVEHLATFEQRDVFTVDLSECDVAAMYLLPRYMTRLIPQFQKMKPGSRIVAHDFVIEGIPPDKTVTVVGDEKTKDHYIHLWITPLKVPEKEP
jgi:SAM-dependent methyltransferase